MTNVVTGPLVQSVVTDPLKDPKAPVEFKTLDEMPAHESVTMLYYGGSGTGKTMFVGSAGPRTLIINIGDGLTTIQSEFARKAFYKNGFPIVATIREKIDPKTGLFEAADAFDQVKNSIEWAMDHFADRFDTIAVDDATQLRSFAMNKGLELNDEWDRSKTLAKGKVQGGYILAVQDYGAEMDLIEKFVAQTISFCKNEKKHFILTAHERHIFKKVRDNTGKVIGEEIDKIRPGFTGKTFPDDITNYFDLVWRAEAVRAGGKSVYRCNTEDTAQIKAKSRYPGLFKNPEVWPEWLKLHAAIKASGAKQ
jgi:hypothetical protein